jgi:hypothetical protein
MVPPPNATKGEREVAEREFQALSRAAARRERITGSQEEFMDILRDDSLKKSAFLQVRILSAYCLGEVGGDDSSVAGVLRWTIELDDTIGDLEVACLQSLVKRLGSAALPDLTAAWRRDGPGRRYVRGEALKGIGFLGDTRLWEEVIARSTAEPCSGA